MKKFFVTAIMAMGMGCAFAQTEIVTNDTITNDSTNTIALNDTVVTEPNKSEPVVEQNITLNDTVVTDSTKNKVIIYCDNKATEKAIRALSSLMR